MHYSCFFFKIKWSIYWTRNTNSLCLLSLLVCSILWHAVYFVRVLYLVCESIRNESAYAVTVFLVRAHFVLFRIPSHPKGLHYRSCEIQVSDLDRQRWVPLERDEQKSESRTGLVRTKDRTSKRERGGESSCEFYVNPIAGWNRLHRSGSKIYLRG